MRYLTAAGLLQSSWPLFFRLGSVRFPLPDRRGLRSLLVLEVFVLFGKERKVYVVLVQVAIVFKHCGGMREFW